MIVGKPADILLRPSLALDKANLRLERFATIGLIFVLGLMAAISLGVASHVASVTSLTTTNVELSEQFERARVAVVVEESLERKYRLEPSIGLRKTFQGVATTFERTMTEIAAVGSDGDKSLSAETLTKQKDYLHAIGRMFDAVDAGDTARAIAIDQNEVDPQFDDIEAHVFVAADTHRDLAHAGIETMRRTHDVGVISIIVGILISWALVALLWRVLRNYQRSIHDTSTREIEASRLNERRTRALIEKTRDVFFLCDASGKLQFASHALQAHWGHDAAMFCRGSIEEIIHPDDRATFALAWKDVMLSETAHLLLEIRALHADGRVLFANVALQNFIGDPAVHGIVVTLHDVSERRALELELSHQAFHDSLTGLPNRTLFKDRLEHAIARARRGGHFVGLLYLDLDNFKAI